MIDVDGRRVLHLLHGEVELDRGLEAEAEQNDEWIESRRYMGLEILAVCWKAIQSDMG